MRLQQAIDDGLQALQRQQRSDGSFQSFSSELIDDFRHASPTDTVFQQAIMLRALAGIAHPIAGKICGRLCDYLMTQVDNHDSFNYWDSHSKEFVYQPYPNDLDDTFCAWQAIGRYRPATIDGERLARLARILIAAEKEPGGPYRTWLIDDDASQQWRDIDVVVNANIMGFLATYDVQLPNVERLIEQSIKNGTLQSRYYPSWYPAAYSVSSWYQGPESQKLIDMASQALASPVGQLSSCDRALLITSFINLNQTQTVTPILEKAIDMLLNQQIEGGWTAHGFCFDPARHGSPWFAGSMALTTSLCIEALAAYEQHARKQLKPQRTTNPIHPQEALAWSAVERHIKSLAQDLRLPAQDLFQKVKAASRRHHICLLPIMVAEVALRRPLSEQYGGGELYSEAELRALCVASIYGWMAYTLYDDMIDGDAAIDLLPLANICMRQMRNRFRLAVPNEDFQIYVDMVLDRMDETNAWELQYCRVDPSAIRLSTLPDYKQGKRLAWRAGGYSLGTMGVLPIMGYQIGSEAAQHLDQFFHHLVIARQLHDEAHDWEEDLRGGHINAAGLRVLLQLRDEGVRRVNVLQEPIATRMRQIFWHDQVDAMVEEILENCLAARQCIDRCTIIQDPSFLVGVVQGIEQNAQKTRLERTQAEAFIKGLYSGKGRRNPQKNDSD